MQSIDRAGRVTDYTYAPSEKLTSTTRYLCEAGSNTPVRIGYDLDEQVNVLRISEPRGRYVESYQLDIEDRVTSITNIEGQVMTMDYSGGDFVTQTVRFDGSSISNAYDSAGRKSSVAYRTAGGSPAATVSYSYYPDGELKTISDGSSAITNSFARLNRLVAVTSSVPPVISVVNHQHDAVGNVTNTTVSSAGSAALCETSYSFDAAERLMKISRRGTEEQRNRGAEVCLFLLADKWTGFLGFKYRFRHRLFL